MSVREPEPPGQSESDGGHPAAGLPGIFYAVVGNTLAAGVTNTFVWFAVTFWVYLETRSVLATSIMAGVYTAATAGSGFFLGSLVDRFPKKLAMLGSSLGSLALFALAWALFVASPADRFTDPLSPTLLAFILLSLTGAIVGNIRTIALSTLVTVMIPEEGRERANGLVGTATGISFFVASTFSGLAIGQLGMGWTLLIAVGLTALTIVHLVTLALPDHAAAADGAGETADESAAEQGGGIDIPGTIRAIKAVPGLFAFLFFQSFNNFLGGVFMALMDPYGLSLVSVEAWGIIFGVLSLGFIVGGLIVSKVGLGGRPLRALFLVNLVLWTTCIFFTIQPSIVLLVGGLAVWLSLIPVVEAAEQTILQKVIPSERQGRVFGFAQSVEQAASPVTAFLIGPIAALVFIPLMTDGAGAELIGGWFGTGPDRGIALVFTLAGVVGLIATALAMRSRAYRDLTATYQEQPEDGIPAAEPSAAG